MVQGIKKADVFTGMRDLGSDAFERSRRTGEIGPVIDYRNLTSSRLMILDPMLLEKMHPVSPIPRHITNIAVVRLDCATRR